MKRAVLLIVCGLIVNALILGLAVTNRRLTQQLDDLRAERDQEKRRLDAALELVDRATLELEATVPVRAAQLRVDAGIVRRGDLGYFRPSPEARFMFRFDELL